MSLWKRGRQYWTDFTVAGRRYRKRLGTTNLRTATRRERELVEEAGHGRLAADEQGPKRLSDATDAYLAAKRIRCSPRTIELEEERLTLSDMLIVMLLTAQCRGEVCTMRWQDIDLSTGWWLIPAEP